MKGYPLGNCPNIIPIIHEPIEFYEENGKQKYRVLESRIIGVRRCACMSYIILDRQPFSATSGFDPAAVLVRCKECKSEYYLFPLIKKVSL